MEYNIYMVKTISKVLDIPNIFVSKKLEQEISKILFNYDKLSREEIYSEFQNILQKYPKIPENTQFNTIRLDDKLKNIFDLIKIQPHSILDIGAGNGDIIKAVGKYYHIANNNLYAIDNKLIASDDLTVLKYIDGVIPLPDNTIDVIILFSVLHHTPVINRQSLLKELKRLLSPNGIIIIREHDDNQNVDYHNFIDLTHIFWYSFNSETEDELFLMTRSETQSLFLSVGLYPIRYNPYLRQNPQRLYHEIYGHQSK